MLLALQLNNLLESGGPTPQPPTLLGQIPNISATFDTGTHQYDLSDYFANANTYAIAPALETGWSFDTNTGILTIDTDVAAGFGPYILTATNAQGDTPSNAFGITVAEPSTGTRRRSMFVPPSNRRKTQPQTIQAQIARITRILK